MKNLSPANPGHDRINWQQVRILYRHEMRGAFREKTIVIKSILIPIFLYPFFLWILFTGMTFMAGQTEGLRSRIVVENWPAGHLELRRAMERDKQILLIDPKGRPSDLDQEVRVGKVDALLRFARVAGMEKTLPRNFEARLTYDQSKEASVAARDRIKEILDRHRADWLRREAQERGVSASQWQAFTISVRNVASGQQMGSFFLGLMVPIIFVVMVAMGCFYPAVDALAGERERNTWETLMSTAANRVSIVAAKYLYIISLGGLAGALNLFAVMITIKPLLSPLFEGAGMIIETRLPLAAIPMLAIAAVLLAGFVAAGMMIFASFARTFREGQAMVTPFYMVILIPMIFLQVPGILLTVPLTFVPILNITLMIRETVSGNFHWLQIGLTVAVSLVLITICIRLVAFILQFENIVVGSYNGSFWRFLSERMRGKQAKTATRAGE